MRTLTILLLLTVALTIAAADIPRQISYQGFLGTDDGSPVTDGDHDFVFRLYDVEEGGTPLWTESQILDVEDGYFQAWLGSVSTLDLAFDRPYCLEIMVDDELLGPRARLTGAPYAFRAAVADSVLGSFDDGDWTIDGEDVYRLDGHVGIGGLPLSVDALTVWGQMGLHGYLNANGATFTNNVEIEEQLTVSEPSHLGELSVGGSADFNGFAEFQEGVSMSGGLDVYGPLAARGGFFVSGGSAAGQVLTRDALGYGTWQDPPGTGAPGSNGQLVYNDGGSLGGAELYYDKASGTLGLGGAANPSYRLRVAGGASVENGLGVQGGASFHGLSNFSDEVNFMDDLSVNGPLWIAGGTSGQVLTKSSGGPAQWEFAPGTEPPGVNMQIPANLGGGWGATNLHYDWVNARLGVNRSNPSYTLDVAGEMRASGLIHGSVENAYALEGYAYDDLVDQFVDAGEHGAITPGMIAPDAVSGAEIADESVGPTEMAESYKSTFMNVPFVDGGRFLDPSYFNWSNPDIRMEGWMGRPYYIVVNTTPDDVAEAWLLYEYGGQTVWYMGNSDNEDHYVFIYLPEDEERNFFEFHITSMSSGHYWYIHWKGTMREDYSLQGVVEWGRY